MTGIKHQFAASSIWVVLGRGSTNLASFLIFTLLARLLGPDDLGFVAFAALFIEITRPLATAGFPQALIQRPDWDEQVAATAFWSSVALATLLALILWGVFTPFMVANYDPGMKWVLPALAATLIIDALRAPHEALLQRRFSYKAIARQSVTATILAGILGVAMAYQGFGIWALVANRAATSIVSTFMIWKMAGWTPKATFSVERLKPLLAYGLHLTGAGLFGQINRQVMVMLIGAILGPAAVGFFRVGSRAVEMISDAIVQPMNVTALSALSRVNETGSVAHAYLRITRTCGLLSFPVYFGTAVIAGDFVTVCFGAKWATSGQVMAMFALFGGAGTLNFFSAPALSAVGQTRLVFWSTLFSLLSSIAITLMTIRYGVAAVALGFAIRAYVLLPFTLFMLQRGLQLSPMAAIRGVWPPFLAGVLMALALWAVKAELLGGIAPLERLAILVPMGAAFYAAALFTLGRTYAGEMYAELSPIVLHLTKRFRRPV
jgi:PST family polysaccharide transporter